MNTNPIIVYAGLAVFIILAAAALIIMLKKTQGGKAIVRASQEAHELVDRAKAQADKTVKDAERAAKDKIASADQEFENRTREKSRKINEMERRLIHKEENLERKSQGLDRRDREISNKERKVAQKEKDVELVEEKANELVKKQVEELERVAGLSQEEAKTQIIRKIEDQARIEAVQVVKQVEEETRAKSKQLAAEVISGAIQRSAAEHVVETTVSVVDLPCDDMKGRIIGREGRNIRALEMATGVDIIVDDTPEAVILSSFDPIRREVARLAIQKLVVDGRIHPARIEDIVENVRQDLEEKMRQEGESVAYELHVQNLHPELVKLMGRLRYRTSYGQNVLQHSKEVAFLAAAMATGARAEHPRGPPGRAPSRRRQGRRPRGRGHAHRAVRGALPQVRRDRRRSSPPSPATTATWTSPRSRPSSSRPPTRSRPPGPGARRELLESYIKRLEKLEGLAKGFEGVSKAFALQAGREIRIMVEAAKVSDDKAAVIAKDIAAKIKSDLEYPGQIKVVVIREMRAVEYAR